MIMREILFRGKRTDNNEWVDGCFYQESDCESYIIPSQTLWYVESDGDDFRAVYTAHRVNIDTIGQYTGIKDKNGTKIFEGDVVKFEYWKPSVAVHAKIEYLSDEARFMMNSNESTYYHFSDAHHNSIEVIGNIHDNPELIK